MGVLLKTALLLALVGVAFGASRIDLADTHPDYPGQCFDKETQRGYAVGQSWPAKDECATFACFLQGGDLYYSFTGCGLAQPGPGCRLVSNTGNHPKCCPSVSCS